MSPRPDAVAIEELTAKAARVQLALQSVRGHARSDGAHVRIEVGIDGRITDIALSQHFSQLEPEAAEGLIARTHAAALDDATRAAQSIRRELLDDPRVGRLVDTVVAEPDSPAGSVVVRDEEPLQPTSIYERW